MEFSWLLGLDYWENRFVLQQCGAVRKFYLTSYNTHHVIHLCLPFWWVCKHRRSSFFPIDRRSNTNSMLFLLSLVFDHLVSIVEWYASFLDLNLPLECRLSNKILTFKSRVTTMILLFSVSCFLIPNCGSDPRWRSVIWINKKHTYDEASVD